MYVSPAVRTVRDDPVAGESVDLLLEAAEGATTRDLAAAVGEFGTVREELAFETLRVTVAHERVGAVCALDGIAVVETADTLGVGADGAGEDVRPGE